MPALGVHFGGPDRPPGCLRDLLCARVDAVPGGGRVDFVTYYFRDRGLARSLLRAADRGVRVGVTLDGWPRTPRANDAVIALLRPLGTDLRVVRHPMDRMPWGKLVRPRLHEKLYCFSHPEPAALIGSFNPSGDRPEQDPAVLREIGDQDRGHNLLVEIRERALVDGLAAHARELHARRHGALDRFLPSSNRRLVGDSAAIHFLPRILRDPVIALLRRCGPRHRVRIAASHFSGPTSLAMLRSLRRRGAAVEILAESTERRVPSRVAARIRATGASIHRVGDPEGLPMHAKFTLVDGAGERYAIFGSFNWTEPSRRFNREIGAISSEAAIFQALDDRWELLRTLATADPGD